MKYDFSLTFIHRKSWGCVLSLPQLTRSKSKGKTWKGCQTIIALTHTHRQTLCAIFWVPNSGPSWTLRSAMGWKDRCLTTCAVVYSVKRGKLQFVLSFNASLSVFSEEDVAKSRKRSQKILDYGFTTNWHQLALVCSVQGCGQAFRDAVTRNCKPDWQGIIPYCNNTTAARHKLSVVRLPCCLPTSWTGTVCILKANQTETFWKQQSWQHIGWRSHDSWFHPLAQVKSWPRHWLSVGKTY